MGKHTLTHRRIFSSLIIFLFLLQCFWTPTNAFARQETAPEEKSSALPAEICIAEGTVPLEDDVLGSVKQAFSDSKAELDFSNAQCFAPVDIRDEGQWALISFVGLRSVPHDSNWTVMEDGVWSDNVIVFKSGTEIISAVAGTKLFSDLLAKVPENIISFQSKMVLDPLVNQSHNNLAAESFVFPFQTGYYAYYFTKDGGVHPGEFGAVMGSGTLAVDLGAAGGSSISNPVPNHLLAVSGGSVIKKCSDTSKSTTYIVISNGSSKFLYAHILSSTAPKLGDTISQGQYIGQLRTGTFNDSNCGYAQQNQTSFHVHFEFPSTSQLTLGDWTLNTSTETWSRGSETWPAGQWRKIGTGSSTSGCQNYSYTGVVLFESKDCKDGKKEYSTVGPRNLPELGFNDRTSSIHVAPGWSVKVYEHDLGAGSWRCWAQSAWDLSKDRYTSGNTGLTIDETITSIEVFNNSSCSGSFWGKTILYDGSEYRGDSVSVTGTGLLLLEAQTTFNDRVESILLPRNWSARLYEHNSRSSPSTCIRGSDSNLQDNRYSSGGTVGGTVTWVDIYNQSDCPAIVTPPPAPSLNSPANNATTGRYDTVTLSWNSASGATEYYAEFSGGPGFAANSGWISGRSYTVGSNFWGGVYTWRVKARNSAGEGGWSSTHTLYRKYGAPGNLTTSGLTQNQVTLSWTASADAPGNLDGYRIYRNGTAVATVGSSTTSYTSTGLSCSSSYDFYVKAYKGNLESDPSSTRTVTTSGCPAGAPTLMNPPDGAYFYEDEPITLSWSSTGDQYYGEVSGGPGGVLTFGWQSGTAKDLGAQWAGYAYSWKVKARNSNGESGYSSTRTFTVRPAQPTNLTASAAACSRVNLSWEDRSTSEQGYQIYRNGSLIATVESDTTSYQDSSVHEDLGYVYSVYAYRGSIQSLESISVFVVTPMCPPANDHFDSPTVISSLPYTHQQRTFGAGIQPDEPQYPIGWSNSASVWFSYKPLSTGIYAVDSYGSSYDTVLHVFEKTTTGDLVPIQGDDDEPDPNGLQSRVVFTGKANITYLFSLTHYGDGAGGLLTVNVSQVPCPASSLCVTASRPDHRPVTRTGQVHTSAGEYAGWLDFDEYGFGAIDNLPSGSYNLFVTDWGVFKKVEGVPASGYLGVTTDDLPSSEIILKDLDGNPVDAVVYFETEDSVFNLGYSYSDWPLVVHASPGDYLVGLRGDTDPYLTYHRLRLEPGMVAVEDIYDVSASPALVYTYHTEGIPGVNLILWRGNHGLSLNLSDGQSAVLSFPQDMSFYSDQEIIIDNTTDSWHYVFPIGDISIQQFRQVEDIYIGGPLMYWVSAVDSPYGLGDRAGFDYVITDVYGNFLWDTYSYPITDSEGTASRAANDTESRLAEMNSYQPEAVRPGFSAPLSPSDHPQDVFQTAQVDQVAGSLEVLDPSGTLRYQAPLDDWRGWHEWTVPEDAPLGTWIVQVSTGGLGAWQEDVFGAGIFEVKNTPAPANDEIDRAEAIDTVPYSISLDTFGATQAGDDPDMPDCNLAAPEASVWFQYRPSSTGILNVNTIGSDYDTVLAVWTGSRGSLHLVGCNDDRSLDPHDQDSELTLPADEGVNYFIMAGKYNGSLSENTSAAISAVTPKGINTMGAGILQLQVDLSASPPWQAEPTAPSGVETTRTPVFRWVPGWNATQYLLRINDASGGAVYERWLDGAAICSTGTCSFTLDRPLANGSYHWQVLTRNSIGDGPWSAEMEFSVESQEPVWQAVFLPFLKCQR